MKGESAVADHPGSPPSDSITGEAVPDAGLGGLRRALDNEEGGEAAAALGQAGPAPLRSGDGAIAPVEAAVPGR